MTSHFLRSAENAARQTGRHRKLAYAIAFSLRSFSIKRSLKLNPSTLKIGINPARTRINWHFDRRAAHRKFGYAKHFYKRSET